MLAGKVVAKRRYSEFFTVHEELMKIFTDFEYPRFPGKWPFQLSEVQMEKRRAALENYLQKSKRDDRQKRDFSHLKIVYFRIRA